MKLTPPLQMKLTQKKIFSKSFFSMTIILSVLLSLVGPSFAVDDPAGEVEHVRTRIRDKKAHWTATENSMTKMTDHERRVRGSGLRFRNMSVSSNGITYKSALPVASDTPTAPVYLASAPSGGFDWRANGGTNYTTPVKNQGVCGSCWAFSATATLESYTLIHGVYDSSLNLSEQILLSCSGAGSCNGGTLSGPAEYFRLTGLPGENKYPYISANGTCSNAASGWQTQTKKIGSWVNITGYTVSASNVSKIKDAVYTYGPVSVGFLVYSDFYSYGGGAYSHTGGTLEGGHAIEVVGYADDAAIPGGGYFICKNSWGTGWGEPFGDQPGGYFRIAYSEVTSPVQFGIETMAYATDTTGLNVSETSATLPAAGVSGTVSVTTTPSTLAWSAGVHYVTGFDNWLTVTPSFARTTGAGSISYTATANNTGATRSIDIWFLDADRGVLLAKDTITQPPVNVVTYTVGGTVKVGSVAIPGATVSLAGKTATTTSTGAFSIAGVPVGTYILGVSAPGYVTYSNSSYVVTGNQTVAVVLVKATYTLSGKISSSLDASPLAGATVKLGTKTATTASDGTYSIPGSLAGTYSLNVTASKYITFTNTNYSLTGNQAFNNSMAPITYSVSGSVKIGSVSIAGATVALGDKITTTSSTGTFSFAGVLPGIYTMGVTAEGYLPYSGSVIVTTANKTAAVVLAKIPYTLSGTIHSNINGSPLAGATVRFGTKSVKTAADGTYSIPGTITGTYPLTVSASGYISYTTSGYVFSGNQAFNCALAPVTYTVSGTVKNGNVAVPGATVVLGDKTTTTSSTGTYSFTGVLPGTYSLGVTDDGYLAYSASVVVTTTNKTTTVSLEPITYTVSGTILSGGSTGPVLAGATVKFGTKTATTNTQGVFSIAGILPGTYTYTVSKPGFKTVTSSCTMSGNQSFNISLLK